MLENSGKSSNVIWPAKSSGVTRKALNISESRPFMEEFNGRLCVLYVCVEPMLKQNIKLHIILF